MKKTAVVGMIALLGSAAHADGYLGASVGRGKVSVDCAAGETCSDRVSVFKLYAGTRIHEGARIDIGVEAAYLRTVNEVQRRSTTLRQGLVGTPPEFEGDPWTTTPSLGSVPFRQDFSIDAIVIAPVFTFKVTPKFNMFVKPGVGLVTTTLKNRVENVVVANPDSEDFRYSRGGSERSDSEFQVQPYISLGVDFAVLPTLKIVGSFDYLGYKSKGENAAREIRKESGSLKNLNVGAQYQF